MLTELINFLERELLISSNSLKLALKQTLEYDIFLPLVLFQYGIIDLEQLEIIFDWIDNYS